MKQNGFVRSVLVVILACFACAPPPPAPPGATAVAPSGTDLTFGALPPGRNPPETLRSNGYYLLEFDH